MSPAAESGILLRVGFLQSKRKLHFDGGNRIFKDCPDDVASVGIFQRKGIGIRQFPGRKGVQKVPLKICDFYLVAILRRMRKIKMEFFVGKIYKADPVFIFPPGFPGLGLTIFCKVNDLPGEVEVRIVTT